tara:strand:- start:1011 stop:1139 length:129 start_codon:yes stop_codon:yes gene_type:complete
MISANIFPKINEPATNKENNNITKWLFIFMFSELIIQNHAYF